MRRVPLCSGEIMPRPARSILSIAASARPTLMYALAASSSRDEVAAPGGYSVTSARENRGLMQKGVVVDLLNEEIRHVGARDEPTCPVARIDQSAIGVRLRPIG
jgi:hypothetical protein